MDLKETTPVRIVNNTDESFDYEFKREKYRLEPNSEAFWPWNVTKSFLGDPFAKDTPSFENFTHGVLVAQRNLGAMRRLGKRGIPHEVIKFPDWDPVKPDIQVYNMSGERIQMAHELDKQGQDFTTGYTESDMKMRVAELEAQLANMRQSMEHDDKPFVVTESAAGEDRVSTFDELPEDGGPKTRPNRRVPDEIG